MWTKKSVIGGLAALLIITTGIFCTWPQIGITHLSATLSDSVPASSAITPANDFSQNESIAWEANEDISSVTDTSKTINGDSIYDTLYIPLSAVVVALLGVAITVYIFLCEGLRELKQNKGYLIRVVDKLKSDYGLILIVLSFIGLMSIAISVILANQQFVVSLYTLYIISSFFSIGLLIWFNISLIDYDKNIAYQAKQMLKKSVKNALHIKYSRKDEVMQFIKIMNDLRTICGFIIEQSIKSIGNLPENDMLASALTYRTKDFRFATDVAKRYKELSDVFDYTLSTMEYRNNKNSSVDNEFEEFYVPLNIVCNLELDIVARCMSNGLFEDIVLSGKNFSEPNFINTSFKKSLLNGVKLTNAALDGSSFSGCLMQNIEIYCDDTEKHYKNIDFSDVFFENFNITNLKFENCTFTGADFTGQGKLHNVLLERSVLVRSNFGDCELIDVSFNWSDASETNMFRNVLNNIKMEHIRLSRAKVIDAKLTDCVLTNAYCDDISFTNSILVSVDFTHSLLTRADFSHATINSNTRFDYCLCNDSLYINTEAKGSQDKFVSFRFAQLRNAQFICGEYKHCDFTGTIFDGAMLSAQTRFIECDFTEASFIDADVYSEFVNCKNMPVGRCSIANTGHDSSCYDVILRRKSTRSFSDQIIPSHIIERILEAARWAPSAKNRQPWNYKIILSPDEIKKISDLLSEKGDSIQETAKSIRSARALILVGRDKNAKSEDRLPDLLSIGASVENMLLAATEAGLDNLWVCDILDARDEIQIELDFKSELVSAVCLGYKDNYSDGRTRKSLNEIIDYGNKQ